MTPIIIYPENKRQQSLLKHLLEEKKIRFEVGNPNRALSRDAFLAKIDKSIAQAEAGKTRTLSAEEQRAFLGL